MLAAEADDEQAFYRMYDELECFCNEHQDSKQDHPVLWETLADFTEDNVKAISVYRQAFSLADTLKENEYKASIQFSLAQRLVENEEIEDAKESLSLAAKFAAYTEDYELQQEISSFSDLLLN